MPKVGSDGPARESDVAFTEQQKSAWEKTIEDAETMADERRENGWETTLIRTGYTGPESRSHGQTDRFGLVTVIPGNDVEEFSELFERGSFSQYDVKVAETAGRVFFVTELLDPAESLAMLIVGNYRLADAEGLIRTSADEGVTYTHVQKLDSSHLGSFEHQDWKKFFPNAESFLQE